MDSCRFSHPFRPGVALTTRPPTLPPGVVFPCFTLIFGSLLNSFNSADFGASVSRYAQLFAIIALATFVGSALEVGLTMISAERQVMRMRKAYLHALLRQSPAWHDTHKDSGEVASRLSEDMLTIQGGMGEKLAMGVQCVAAAWARARGEGGGAQRHVTRPPRFPPQVRRDLWCRPRCGLLHQVRIGS